LKSTIYASTIPYATDSTEREKHLLSNHDANIRMNESTNICE